MNDEGGADRLQDEPIRFTDEEAAFLRHVRFGELPPRVTPAERVESVETEPRRDLPEPVDGPAEWRLPYW